MSLGNMERSVEISLSKGNVNNAFTSLLLATGHIHEDDVITSVVLPANWQGEVDLVKFKIKKEDKTN